MMKLNNRTKEDKEFFRLAPVDDEGYAEEENGSLELQPGRSLVEMQFRLDPRNGHNDADSGLRPADGSSPTYLIYFPGFKGAISCSPVAGTEDIRLVIRFNLEFLEAMIGEDDPEVLQFLKRRSDKKYNIPKHAITPQMRMVINELLWCSETGKMKRLFWLSKILELLMLQIEQLETPKPALKSVKFYDVEKLQQAKAIVENNLATPYSLKDLAHKVGLNEFKLKRGFKELFGYTVFGYLHELRMLEAKRLLTTGKDSVADVSDEVGYQYPHHFSTAFKKRFGVLPRTLMV